MSWFVILILTSVKLFEDVFPPEWNCLEYQMLSVLHIDNKLCSFVLSGVCCPVGQGFPKLQASFLSFAIFFYLKINFASDLVNKSTQNLEAELYPR